MWRIIAIPLILVQTRMETGQGKGLKRDIPDWLKD